MAISIVSYDKIEFTNGKVLEIPVFSSSYQTIPAGTLWVPPCKCVIATTVGYGRMVGNRSDTWGLPLGLENAWEDLDGNKWYLKEIYTGNRYHSFHIVAGPYGELNYGMSGKDDLATYTVSVTVAYVYRISGTNYWDVIYGSGFSYHMIKGVGPSKSSNAPGRYTFEEFVNNTYRGTVIDAYRWYQWRDFGWMRCYNSTTSDVRFITNNGSKAISSLTNSYKTNITPGIYDDDPNRQDGNSTTGGGTGNFDRSSDNISIPSLPTLNATKAGFVTLFKPSLNDLINIAEYLWSANIINILTSYFANPMDIIIGLGIVPVDPTASSSDFPSAGIITVPFSIPIIDSQYFEFDCGSLTIEEFWGSALDYAPYTQIQIYLPYIGIRELNVDEIMGHSIGVKYHIDLFGGGTIVFVTVDGSAKYQYTGNCLQQIPVNAANYDSLVQNLVSLACVVGSGIAAAGAGAATAIEASAANAGYNEMAGQIGVVDYMTSAGAEQVASDAAFGAKAGLSEWNANGGMQKLGNCAVNSVMSAKPRIERTGAIGNTVGQMAVQTPYLIITRPEQSLPANYKHFLGYPSNITSKLGDLEGYTEVASIRLNDLAATQPEIAEIYNLLEKGVII